MPADFALLNLDRSYLSAEFLEFYGRVNLMKGAIVLADGVSTVSPTYAREVSSDPELGFGLEGVLRAKGERFVGILNGADYNEWNPAIDPDDRGALHAGAIRAGKAICAPRAARAARAADGLAAGRWWGWFADDARKRVSICWLDALDELMALDIELVILGSGEPAIEERFRGCRGTLSRIGCALAPLSTMNWLIKSRPGATCS